MTNAAEFLDLSAERSPQRTFLVHEGRRYSYSEIRRLANQTAAGLAAGGFGGGDKIAIACINRPGFIVAYYAILKIGATAVVLSTGLKKRDLRYQLRNSGATALFCHDGTGPENAAFTVAALEAAAAEGGAPVWLIPADPTKKSWINGTASLCDLLEGRPADYPTAATAGGETAVVPYTSGTLNRPKGVEISHDNIVDMARLNVTLAPTEWCGVRLVATPLFHIMGQISGLAVPALCGQTLVLVERFDPDQALRLMAEEQVSYMAGTPLLFRSLLDAAKGADAKTIRKHLKLCAAGGAPLPCEWSDEFESRFGVPLLQGYGATETTSVVSWNWPSCPPKLNSAGRVVPGVKVRIIGSSGDEAPSGETGHITVQSPGNMKGYLGNARATKSALRDGWYWTGDIGYLDEEGYLFWVRRTDDVIVRWTGTNISPTEIETVLLRHPLISHAVVVGRFSRAGQKVVVIVVPKPHSVVNEDDIRDWLARQLPDNHMPDIIEIKPVIPMGETGKIARQQCR